MSSVGETCVRSFAMMAYCDAFFSHPLTSVLPLLHRTVSGIAISPIGGMFCLFFIVLYQVLLYHRLEGMCTFIRNDGLQNAFSCLLL
jgi:hypothetical protein